LSILPLAAPVFPAARHVVYPVHVCARDLGLVAGALRHSPYSIVSFTGNGSHE
jgi:hypothetical protein